MSYEIVKSIRLVQDDDKSWYAIVTSATNNCYPHLYEKWNFCKGLLYTKEQLQAEILLDFYYGNFHGGTNTKYGKFLKFLGGAWGVYNQDSLACRTYHFYEHIEDIIREKYYNATGEERERLGHFRSWLCDRQRTQVKRKLYNEFLQFSDNCEPTILRLWYDNQPTGEYAMMMYKQKNGVYLTTTYDNATKFTSLARLSKVERTLKNHGYKVERIQVSL